MAWKEEGEKRVDVADSGDEAENGIGRGPNLGIASTDQRMVDIPETQTTVAECSGVEEAMR
jgi:hypothetical protein